MEYVLFTLPSKEWCTYIAIIFGSIAALIYVKEIWKGHKPPYTTIIVWLILGLSLLYFHGKTEATWSLALLVVYAVVPAIYLIELCYLKVKWSMQKRDMLCLLLAGLSWMIWLFTKKLEDSSNLTVWIPLLALVSTDAFGSWPIFQNAWQGKEFEGRFSWLCTLVAVSAELGTINNYKSPEVLLPAYFFVMMGGTALCALFRRTIRYTPAPWAPKHSTPSNTSYTR